MVLSMFRTETQQLTWDLADSIHTFPNRYTTPGRPFQPHALQIGSGLQPRAVGGDTLIVVRFFEGIQPIEAEHLFSVRPLHQGELAGVQLDLHWSRAGSAVFLLSPRTFHLAGVGKGKSRGNVRFKLQIPSWNRGTQWRRSLKRTQLVKALRQNGILRFCFRLHFNRHLCC